MSASVHASKLWINEGLGRFHAGERFRETRIEWAGDLDLDGDPDLLVSQAGTSSFTPGLSEIGMFLGTPGSPGSPPTFAQDPRLCCWSFDPLQGDITSDDHLLDGYPDFAIVRSLDGSNFEPLALINTFGFGGSILANVTLADAGFDLNADALIALGDVNGDGISDAVFGTHQDELVDISEVHIKKTASGFGTNSYDWAFQILPAGLLVDLDTDGDLDLVGERIVFNRTSP